ncbi:MAG: FecR family protein [Treponema sp.]|jgi:hypothetical protein|nr:FecR family protein [Treponema sp.]
MRKNRNTKFRAVDLCITSLCLAGTVVSGAVFWGEYNRTLVKLNEEPVGTIVFKNRTADRKIEDRAAWDRLKQESPVYNGDTIRTAESSQAIITFLDEVTVVDLSERTLIQVFYDEEGSRIDLSGGDVEVSAGSRNVFVLNGDSGVEIERNSHASLNRGGGGFGFSVFEGRARHGGEEVSAGQGLSFLDDGSPDTSPSVVMTSLGKSARVLGAEEGAVPVVFAWNEANFSDATHVVVEVAEDRGFHRVVQAGDVRDASSVSLPLENGVYFWRAYPVVGESAEPAGRTYPSGKIEVLPFPVIRPISPAPQAAFSFSGDSRIPLSWTGTEGAGGYLLEISAHGDMSNPVVSRQVRATSLVQSGLEPGRWYWRVTPLYQERVGGSAAPSEIREFTIGAGIAVLGPPALNFPSGGGIVDLAQPRLSWDYDADAAYWKVEIADNPGMTNPVVSEDVDVNYYSPPAALLEGGGDYFWRVTAFDRGGGSAVSPVLSFTTEEGRHEQRTIFPPDNYAASVNELAGIRFTYHANASLQNYLQISPGEDFSSLAVNEALESGRRSHVISEADFAGLGPGTWYWRVGGEGESGPAYSLPRRLNLVSVSEAPRISVPPEVGAESPLTVRWDSPPFASYRVDVYSEDNPQARLAEQFTEGNSLTIPPASLPAGAYVVNVRGFYPESARSSRIAGVSGESRFVVLPAAPAVQPPREEARRPVPVPVSLPPVIVAPPPPEPPPVVVAPPSEPPPEPPAAAVVPAEPAPPVRVPEERKIDLTRVSPSGTVTGSFPPEGYSFSTGQLAGVRSVNFTWEGRAREYRFALYRSNGDILVPPEGVSAPVYTLSKPEILEPGDYVWHVFEKDRRGNWGEYPSTAKRFNIIEGAVKTLPTSDPGDLYGNR